MGYRLPSPPPIVLGPSQVVREFQQLSLIQKKAELQSRVEGRQIPMEEARKWTMDDFIRIHFQVPSTTTDAQPLEPLSLRCCC